MDLTFEQMIGWAGGTSIVISGLSYFIGQLIISNRTEKFRLETESKIKILENKLSERTNILNNLIDIQKSNYSLSQEKRIAAVEEIWKIANDFMLGLPNSFIYINNLRMHEYETYLKNSKFPENGDIRHDIRTMEDEGKTLDSFKNYRNKLIYLRPFLGEDLYFAIHSYYTFVVRVFLNNVEQIKNNKLRHWQEDPYAKRLVDKALSEEDILIIVSDKRNSFDYVLQQMERQVLKHMNLLLSGKKASEYSHQHTEELINVLSETENRILKKAI